jgi:exo-beta-1,3-glucanase (GH17 family)
MAGDKPLLIKEPGFPNGPTPFSTDAQRTYWTTLLGSSMRKQVNIGVFDAFRNTPWKHEVISVAGGGRVDIGNHWGVLLDARRRPLPLAIDVLRIWKSSRNDSTGGK